MRNLQNLHSIRGDRFVITFHYVVAFIISFVVTIATTPLVKKLAYTFNILDNPAHRKVHRDPIPSIGGISIILGVIAGYLYIAPQSMYMLPIIIGASFIILTGILDDIVTLSPKVKLIGQIAAAITVISSGLVIEHITVPLIGKIEFGILSYAITLLWIVGITNSINLIDGLDGLAAGVSSIALTSILVMAVLDNQFLVFTLSLIILGGTTGFLLFNFHPAKIFMGDTGALFLGYAISIISILGLFKSVTLFSLIIPIIILAVPIFDTFFAIVRRLLKKQSIARADNRHLHHCLIDMGFSHRITVLIIYGISLFFGISAIIFSASTLWGSLLIVGLLFLLLQLTAELIGIIGDNKKPITNFLKRITASRPTKPLIKRE